jgi:hypothetical protein
MIMTKFYQYAPDGLYIGEVDLDYPTAPEGYTTVAPVGPPWGLYFIDGVWQAPAPALPNHITVGAFFDRFGDQKWPILADTNASVQALIKDASVRKWINLDDPQVLTGLQMVQAAGHDIDPTAIIAAPIQPEERP